MELPMYVGTGLLLVFSYLVAKKRRTNLPPGTKPLPLIGNALDMPTKKAWQTFIKWKEQYGDLVYLDILGQPVIVVNSRKVCDDLLEKRSRKYSDRPRFVMINELMGWDYGLPFMPYSPRWRQHRRLFHQHFNETESRGYISVQEQKMHNFLRNLMKQPENFRGHIRLLFAEMITDVVYGYQIKGHDDNFLKRMGVAMQGLSAAASTGKFWVELFPILKAVPAWVPGAGFKNQATYWRECVLASRNDPASYVKDQIMDVAHNVSAVAYTGGADTNLSAFEAFFLAMANHPKCQKAAQEELDGVLGGSRLPRCEGRGDLPYINAIVKEVLRWHTVLPAGVPHALSEDDEYQGYYLPKGTVVIANTWAFLHDPVVYPVPDTFNPSRWLIDTSTGKKINEKLPSPDIMFGYRRR